MAKEILPVKDRLGLALAGSAPVHYPAADHNKSHPSGGLFMVERVKPKTNFVTER